MCGGTTRRPRAQVMLPQTAPVTSLAFSPSAPHELAATSGEMLFDTLNPLAVIVLYLDAVSGTRVVLFSSTSSPLKAISRFKVRARPRARAARPCTINPLMSYAMVGLCCCRILRTGRITAAMAASS